MPFRCAKHSALDTEYARKLVQSGVVNLKTVYDVGASNGDWSEDMAEVLPDANYHLFEPLSGASSPYYGDMQECLRRFPHFKLHPIALGNINGTLPIQVFPDGFSSTLIPSEYHLINDRHGVPVRRLDDFVEEHHLPKPDLLKIDVQGFELEILKGSQQTLAHTKCLLLETWLYRDYGPDTPLLSDLVQFLDPFDFVATTFGDMYVNESNALISVDIFFLRRDLAAETARRGLKLVT